ncbi:glycosyltransferase family 39 protein [Frondihabitans cladoniiphilus]|uniref:glycosyltransferase family 39 protein n=1 Tax=Frondihabitans cladoniiphilus TaxID=715785 RepID=UPI0031EFD966
MPRPDAPLHSGRLPRAVPWALGAIGLLLAVWGSWIPSLWGDEAASVLSAKRSIPSLFTELAHVDAVHGTYYFALHLWVDLFGASPFSVRFPSAVAVGLGTVAVVLLAERLAGPRTAVIAGVVYCLLPRVTYMGGEARAYAFDAAIAAWALVLLVDLMRGRRRAAGWWVVYGALTALGVYVFLYLGLFVVVHAIVLATSRASRRVWKRWALATALGIVAAAPVVVFDLLERQQVAFLADRSTTSFDTLFAGLWFGDGKVAVVAWALVLVAAVTWVVRRWRRWREGREQTGDARLASSVERASSIPAAPSVEVVAFAALLVPAALLLLSNLVVADFSARYVSMSAPGAALAVAVGIDRLVSLPWRRFTGATRGRRTVVAGLVTALIVVLCIPVYLAQRTPYAQNSSDWAEISATMKAHARPGQAVLFDEDVRPSRNPRLAYRTYAAGFAGLADIGLKTPYWESTSWHDIAYRVSSAVVQQRLTEYPTVWLIEYRTPTHVDDYGLDGLRTAGYVAAATYRTHRSEIIELSRGTTTGE